MIAQPIIAGAGPGHRKQITGASFIDRDEGIEHGDYQVLSAVVRFLGVLEGLGHNFAISLACGLFGAQNIECLAQRAVAAGCFAKLAGQPGQQIGRAQLAAIAAQFMPHHVFHREVLHQRDYIGKRLMKREGIRVGSLHAAPPHAVQDRVRSFVCDNIL